MENYIVSGSQKQPGAARSGGTARNSQRQPDPARSSQEQSGAARGSHKQPEAGPGFSLRDCADARAVGGASHWPQSDPQRKHPNAPGREVCERFPEEAAARAGQATGAKRIPRRSGQTPRVRSVQKDSQEKRQRGQGERRAPKGFPEETEARPGRATGPKRNPRRNRSEGRTRDGAQKDSQKKQQRGQVERRGPKGFPEETATGTGRATGPKRIPWVRAVPQKKRPNARSPNGFPEEAAARTGSATCLEKSKLRGHALQLPGKLKLSFCLPPRPQIQCWVCLRGRPRRDAKKTIVPGFPQH